MYKIYVNDSCLILADQSDQKLLSASADLCMKYGGKPKELFMYIDSLEKSKTTKLIVVYSEELKQLYKDFKSKYKFIRAAGGVVYNEKKIAMIYRHSTWDLPKGKIEKGEKKRSAAKREIQEEIGIFQLELTDKISTTYHTYKLKDGTRVLKKTFWYRMYSSDSLLTPQAEEGIEQAVWCTVEEALEKQPVFQNVTDVLNLL